MIEKCVGLAVVMTGSKTIVAILNEMGAPREADVSLTILDITGRRLQTLASGRFGLGRHPMMWEGHGDRGTAPAGVYFVRFTTAGRTITRRFILVR